MRLYGTIHEWNSFRGCGVVRPNPEGPDLVVHVQDIPLEIDALEVGHPVTYELAISADGTPRAAYILPVTPQASFTRGTPRKRFVFNWNQGITTGLVLAMALFGGLIIIGNWSMSTILTARRQLSWPVEAGNKFASLLG